MNILDVIMIRLAQRGIGETTALKGGYLLNKLLNSRTTTDIDLSYGDMAYWSELRTALIAVGEELKQAGVIVSYDLREPQEQPKRSGGITYRGKNNTVVAGVDASVQDMGFGIKETTLPFESGVVTELTFPAYSFERVVGDKMTATFSRQQFRRSKDLFDIYVIVTTQELSLQTLYTALKERDRTGLLDGDFEEEEYTPFSAEAKEKWAQAWEKLKLDRGAGKAMLKPPLETVLGSYKDFMSKTQGISAVFGDYIWNPLERNWEQDE